MNRFNQRRNALVDIPNPLGNESFYLSEKLEASTTQKTYSFTNETGQDLFLSLSGKTAPGYGIVRFDVMTIYGHHKSNERVMLYELPNVILVSNQLRNTLDCGLPLPGFYDSYSIDYKLSILAHDREDLFVTAAPMRDFFNSRTSVLNFYINQSIAALGTYSGGIYLNPLTKFVNFGSHFVGAYSKDVSLQATMDTAIYETLDSKLATTDKNIHFEFVIPPAWRSVGDAAGTYYDRRLRIFVTNNDVSNSISLTHYAFQFLF